MDFTIKKHEELIKSLSGAGKHFITFSEFLKEEAPGFIMLRHDVEQHYENALEFAKIQNKYGIKGTYFFRILKNHYNEDVVRKIAELGHEVGYHYDDLAKCKGNYDLAIKRFEKHLNLLRKFAPVKTICMDGSPLSKFDNKALWEKYDYKDFGIIGEPYFDIDYKDILYLTDTGRRWDGHKVSIRDKVDSEVKLSFKHTVDIIDRVNELPDKTIFTFHPQRWNDKLIPWIQELILQNIKNMVKGLILIKNNAFIK